MATQSFPKGPNETRGSFTPLGRLALSPPCIAGRGRGDRKAPNNVKCEPRDSHFVNHAECNPVRVYRTGMLHRVVSIALGSPCQALSRPPCGIRTSRPPTVNSFSKSHTPGVISVFSSPVTRASGTSEPRCPLPRSTPHSCIRYLARSKQERGYM